LLPDKSSGFIVSLSIFVCQRQICDLPSLYYQLALGSGKNVVVASRIPGGASVGDKAVQLI
jgi:hypothetical protein